MSYRSIKRVLGETNLERKFRFLFGACLLLLITMSFYIYGRQTEKLVYESNLNTGGLLVDTIIFRLHWKYTSPQEWNDNTLDPEKFRKTGDDVRLANDLAKELQMQDVNYRWTFLSPSPEQTGAKPEDEFEWEVLEDFKRNPNNEPKQRWIPEKQEYHYFQAIQLKEKCTYCHQSPPGQTWEPQQLMSVAKVIIPDAPTQRKLNWNRAILISTAIVTVALAMLAAYIIVRYVIAKPLRHLKEVSDEISRGNIKLRAEILTGDEFEELGRAFNRMLQHLVAVQEELRQVNADLDAKLDQLAQANLTLYEMNSLKSDFLATMSHELRTPLNSILGFSEVLTGIDSLDDRQKRYVNNIRKSGKLLLDMINDILDLAKVESGKMELRLTDIRIELLISAQCDLARPLTEKKNIDLVEKIEPGLPELRQDQAKLQQILANLLSNAIKFTPEGGRIEVVARSYREDQIEVIVADTGVGIADEDQEVIFEKFRQGNTVLPGGDAMTREYSGTGLGLSIVKELCKLLGGSISLRSELGKGSVFTVRLPMRLTEQPVRPHDTDALLEMAKAHRLPFDYRPNNQPSVVRPASDS
ncbi:Integral membrane sensor signal transduction histidine kinase [Planctomycetales bacterium 10988]|nr:Integral membrane sensor signal transduction histidine kinase [Planctomycetales bacterium 10988]